LPTKRSFFCGLLPGSIAAGGIRRALPLTATLATSSAAVGSSQHV
jgi:hypothetical protein